MLKSFDRYLLREITPPFFIGLLIYSFVLLMNQIFLLSELFIARGVSFTAVTLIFVYLVPAVLAFAVPMSVLMGILAALSRLSSDSEITAFRTLGIRNSRIFWPVFLFAFVGWLVTSGLTLYLAPRANYRWVQTLTRFVLSKVQFKIDPREFNESIPQTVIFIQDITPDDRWKNIFVYLNQKADEPRTIFARTGQLNFYHEAKRATLELFDGTIHTVPLAEPERYSITLFDRVEEEINVESLFAQFSSEKRVREKDIGELLRSVERIERDRNSLAAEQASLAASASSRRTAAEARRKEVEFGLQQKGREWRSHWVEIHKKFALPFVCFIFVLIGIPLGISTRKGGRTSGFTISLAIILVYYILITAGEKNAMEGHVSPFLGMWGPNILFLAAGLYLFFRSSRESPLLGSLLRRIKRSSTRIEIIKVRVSTRTRSRPGWRWPRLLLRFPNILDRYIIRKYLAIFLLVFLALLSISVIVTFFERIDNIYQHNQPLSLLFRYIQYRIPEFVNYILPVTVLTTALLTLGLLTKSNEITAMKACGLSIYRLVLSLLVMAGLVSLFSFGLQERLVPSANKKAEEVWNHINEMPARSHGYLDRRWALSRDKERIFHYSYFEPSSGSFSQLSIFDIDPPSWSLEGRLFAEKARLEGNILGLNRGWSRSFPGERQTRFETFESKEFHLAEDTQYFIKEVKEPSLMSFNELKRYTAEVEAMGFETTRFKVDLHSKISFPLVSLVMTLLAIPFAFSMGKRGALVGLGLSIVIAMLYWGALGVFRSLGYVNFLSPFLASWGPSLIFGPIGLYLLFRQRT
ncbi:MAG: LPS export ABC transporter permease LptG [Candidatus Aminicenantales bacterium]